MCRSLVSLLVIAAITVPSYAQIDPNDPTPLISRRYQYPDEIPYQVDANPKAIRGPQAGYNRCNSTTENQNSLCQTAIVNHIDDFCIWAPINPNSTIANTEGVEVVWCTKPGHGTRLIPAGAITGVQYLKAPDYVQIVGFIDQTKVNLQAGDQGGELDPRGADMRGNAIGGLEYSTVFPINGVYDNSTYQQVINWNLFIGGNFFCMKACDPNKPNQEAYCLNTLDRLGCVYNMPNMAKNGTFEVCDSDNMQFPGVYTSNGQVMTYTQPPESLGAITTVPYTVTVPSSSSCVTYQSQALYTGLPGATITGAPAVPTGAAMAAGSTTRSGSVAAATKTSGAASLGISIVASVAGIVFAAILVL